MQDRYLQVGESTKRLIAEYEQHGRIIVAYDFDGTVHDYHGVGDTFPMIIQLLKDLREFATFIVYTCSDEERYPEIRAYLSQNGIPFDTINENVITLNHSKSSKLYYNILLDDRAGLRESYQTLKEFLEYMKTR